MNHSDLMSKFIIIIGLFRLFQRVHDIAIQHADDFWILSIQAFSQFTWTSKYKA